ncbi:hypothetical protein B6S59_18620 [Pseudomonas sp. A46]|nr:hypothetical protein [Pseudomonas sp. A46]OWJ92970.1 hypothetical protein B6S59_18620 [Pseudomonas sp. A46]
MQQKTFTGHCFDVLSECRRSILQVGLFKIVVLLLVLIFSFYDEEFPLAPVFMIWALGLFSAACFLFAEASRRMSTQCDQQREFEK